MKAFIYGIGLQFKLDIRSKTLLITCYAVPLLFFAIMGGIFTSLMPEAKNTLIQSMTVMGVSMGAFIGLPPSLVEIYGGPIKKMYKANGVPLYFGLVSTVLSAFLHLYIMSGIIFAAAQLMYGAFPPADLPLYFAFLSVFLAVSVSVGSVLGLLVKHQAKLTMLSQLIFLPSIMLSGIMFSADLLPGFLVYMGKLFPASWGYMLLTDTGSRFWNLSALFVIFAASAAVCGIILKKMQSR